MSRPFTSMAAAILFFLLPLLSRASSPVIPPFQPDPKSVQRFGPAFRYPQAGWIVLHIEGEPYERGYQHGHLLSREIVNFIKCSAALRSASSPADGWRNLRPLVDALFLRRYDREYLEEMKGIADGATAAGARFDDRPIDLTDIVTLNAWPEIDTLNSALEATPNGLEGIFFPHNQPRAMPDTQAMHCSAFAATGPATADGKVVIGHITMFSLYPSLFYNVWLDVKPSKGQRVFIQGFPGAIQSGLDYYMNDAGLVVCETTLAQTRFDGNGMALASRIRQALQYADTIDKAVAILKTSNNGLYTNEWLLADVKTNEIAMLELGTASTKLYRSGKNEWFGGTEGFYWGCNNTKDLEVRLETIASVHGAPANMVWHPSARDKTWYRLYQEHKGKINVDFAKLAFATPPLAAYHSLDAKFTTTDLAKEMKTWALYGPPLGRSWQPSQEERKLYPGIHAMASNPWTILHANPPPKVETAGAKPVDLMDGITDLDNRKMKEDEKPRNPVTSWHGTLLPRGDGDIWLATAFADYEKFVSREKAFKNRAHDGRLTKEDRDRLGVELLGHRAAFLAGVRQGHETSLTDIHARAIQDDWYKIASGKGMLALHELRRLLGDKRFIDLMVSFGNNHAGKLTSTQEFTYAASQAAGKSLDEFFTVWLRHKGLPSLQLDKVWASQEDSGYQVKGIIHSQGYPAGARVEVTVESMKGEISKDIHLVNSTTPFTITTPDKPRQVVVDKYGFTPKAAGGAFTVTSFAEDLEHTLIVYGTGDEVAANKEAAEHLRRAIIQAGSNITVGVKSDLELAETEISAYHLLLIGRPDSNRLIKRFQSAFPITFGHRSFVARDDCYADSESAVIVVGTNPTNDRFSLIALAGLSCEATLNLPERLLQTPEEGHGEVIVFPVSGKPHTLVLAPRELIRSVQVEKTAVGKRN